MPSERVQRQIDRFLDEADAAVEADNWELVQRLSHRILTLDPENADALALAAAAERGLVSAARREPPADGEAVGIRH